MTEFDQYCMREALNLAAQAATQNEVPVGAVITLDQQIIARGANQPISHNDPTAHAEIVALRAAGQALNNYRLINTTMYVTLEPCVMCAGALLHARISRLVYATSDPKTGAMGGVIHLYDLHHWNHSIACEHGLMADESVKLLREFFQQRR